jgi:hypothetical protein
MRRNSNPSSDADSADSSMPVAEETRSGSDRLIQWTPFTIALGLVFSMMPDRAEWLYVAAVVGGLASIAVGRTLGRLDRVSLQARVRKFAKGWVVVVALAALSFLHGKWQPMVFFAVVGVISSGLFWFGCKSNK